MSMHAETPAAIDEHAQAASRRARALLEQGRPHEAARAFSEALEAAPDSATDHFELGKLLLSIGRLPEALGHLQRASALCPDWADALNSLGIALSEAGLHRDAEQAFRRAVALRPEFAEAHCNLGILLVDLQSLSEAEASLRLALVHDPRFAGARYWLGKLLAQAGRVPEAIDELARLPQPSPMFFDGDELLAQLLERSGRHAEAEVVYRRMIDARPDMAALHEALGGILLSLRRAHDAEIALRRALELNPTAGGAAHNRVIALGQLRRFDEAEVAARRAIEINPMHPWTYFELGNVLLDKGAGDISESLAAFRRAIEIDPDSLIKQTNYAFTLPFHSDDGFAILEACERVTKRFEAPFLARPVEHSNERVHSRRLRVGYVSPDFREHCQSLFMMPLLSNHDHAEVEVYCYSTVRNPDDMSSRLAAFADVWRDVHALDDDQLAACIREDRIDVLVDLTMYMARARPLLFARRPAPVQIAWLAYPGTMGSRAIGYRLTDPYLDPLDQPGADARYSEKSIRLPDTFWCYDPLATGPAVNDLPADRNSYVTFGCLNNPSKLTDRTFALWSKVMKRVAGSRLTVLLNDGSPHDVVRAKFAAMGIDPARLQFVGYRPREQYLTTYLDIDISLDTLPYNGHTTSLDALWMGVPVVSKTGSTPVSRAGYSILTNVGLPELVASSDQAFIEKAVALATDLPRLRALRAGLRERMERSPLMDGARFARGIEQAYRTAWSEYCDAAAASH